MITLDNVKRGSQQEHEIYMQAYLIGNGDREAAKLLNIPVSRVTYWRKKHFLPNRRTGKGRVLTAEEKKLRHKMHREGKTISEMAKQFNVSRDAIIFWCRYHRLPVPPE